MCSRDWISDVCSSDLYLPLREDLFARYGGGMNAQKQAIEQIRPGEVLVIDARQEPRSEEHTSELQSRLHLVCRLLLEKKKKTQHIPSCILYINHARLS